MFITIFNCLLPILAVIALGASLRWRGFVDGETTSAFNGFAYYWALPLFLFYKIALLPSGTRQANLLMMTLLGATLATLMASWMVAACLKIPHASRGAFIQACFRGNLAFIGLPLILFSLESLSRSGGGDNAGQITTQLESAVLLALAPAVILYNVAAVALLSIYNHDQGREFRWSRVLSSIIGNPLFIGCAAGLLFQWMGWTLPVAVERTCAVVGAAAFPLALLGVGSQLAVMPVSQRWRETLWTSAMKCMFCPAAGYVIGSALGLEGIDLKVALLMCAVPTAVSSYVLVDQMNGDQDLAAGAVMVCTLFSLLPLAVLLAI